MAIVTGPCFVLTVMARRSVSKSSKTVCSMLSLMSMAVPLCLEFSLLLVYVV